MTKERIRRWMWIIAGLAAAFTFLWVTVILQQPLGSAVLGAIVCGFIPLAIGGWLLFSPSDSPDAPLRYMGHQRPAITHSDAPDKSNVIRRPKKKKRR